MRKITLTKTREINAFKESFIVDDVTINFQSLFVRVNENFDNLSVLDMQRYIKICNEFSGDVYFKSEYVEIILPVKFLYSLTQVNK